MVRKQSVYRVLVPALVSTGFLLAWAAPAPAARSSDTGGVTARAYQRGIGGPSGIRVSWNRPKTIPSSLILGYVIWRSDDFGGFNLVGGVDNDSSHDFVDVTSTRSVYAYNGAPGQMAGARSLFLNVPGITPGQQYRYQVSAAARSGLLDQDRDGVPDNTQIMTGLSVPSGTVTAIGPPSIATINGQSVGDGEAVPVSTTSFQVEWQQGAGADTYVIWVSSDPGFPAGKRYATKPIRTLPVDLGGSSTVTRTVKLNKGSLRRAKRLFVAVGGRNSRDRFRPVPYGAIFGSAVKVRPIVTPPPPPG